MEMERANTTPAETQKAVSEKIVKKGRKEVEKKVETLQALKVEYLPIDALKPNKYNPNRQSEHDFELLCRSIEEDGFTQPIVALKKDKVIVDGEHRWRAATTLGFKEIPVVLVDMTPEQARISTLRHNRARGSEDIELSASVLRDLQELGALEWAQDSLMMSDLEINRMLEDIPAPEALANEDFGDAWEPDVVGDMERKRISDGSVESVEFESTGGRQATAFSKNAIHAIRDRDLKISQAKDDEEREMAKKEASIYRLSLIFSGEEAVIIKAVLNHAPAETILRLCKTEYDKMET